METGKLQVVVPSPSGEFPTMRTEMISQLIDLSVAFEHARDSIVEDTQRAVQIMQDHAARVREFADGLQAELDRQFKV